MSHSSRKYQAHRAQTEADRLDWPNQPMPTECVSGSSPLWEHKSTTQSTTSNKRTLEDDKQLAQRIREGERLAVQELFRLYSPALFRRIRRLLGGDDVQAEDSLQQVFVKVLQSIHMYRGDSSLHAWLNRITTHTVMDVFRSQKSQMRVFERFKNVRFFSWNIDGNQAIPDQMFFREEAKDIVHRGLQTLGREKRMAVLLCDLEGYSIEEAAHELHIPMGTVASRLYRGRQELRIWIKQEFKKSGRSEEDWLHE